MTTPSLGAPCNSRTAFAWTGCWQRAGRICIIFILGALGCATALAQSFNYTSSGNTAVINNYYGRDPDVIIPEKIASYTVVGIKDRAFANRSDLNRIRLPRTVASIGKEAFLGCSNLTAIVVDDGNQTFSSADGVLVDFRGGTIVHYPEGRSGSFTIPEAVTTIGVEGFARARGLTQVTIGEKVRTIAARAFDECSALTSIRVSPSNPNYRDEQGVLYTRNTVLRFPRAKAGPWTLSEFVTGIADSAFNRCSLLTSIDVSPDNPEFSSLDGVLFDKGQYILIQYPGGKAGTFVVPSSVREIRSNALRECGALTSIEVSPDSWYTSIDGVLYDKDVTHVIQCPGGKAGIYTLPDSVIDLDASAFQGCSNLTTLRLNAASIDPGYIGHTFSVCTSLTDVEVAPTHPTVAAQNGLLYTKNLTALMWCPPGRTGEIAIPDSTTMVWDEAFQKCARLTRIVLGDGLTLEFPIAFDDCHALDSVVLGAKFLAPPEMLRDLFYKNTRLTAVEVSPAHPTLSSLDGLVYSKDFTRLHYCPPGKTGHVTVADLTSTLDYSAFYECTQLTRVVLGQRVELLPESWEYYFDNCPRLAAIDVHPDNTTYSSVDGVVYTKDQTAVLWCPPGKTGEIIIPNTVTKITYGPFTNSNQVNRIVIGNGVSTLDIDAFFGCTALTSVVLGTNVSVLTEILPDYFSSNRRLASIEVAPGHPTLSSVDGVLYTKDLTNFLWCPPGRVGELIILDSVTSLENNQLYRCTLLTRVDLGHGVRKISPEFLHGCTALTSVVLGSQVEVTSEFIGDYFYQNRRLASIEVASAHPTLSSVDGVLYDKAQTTVLWCPSGKTGEIIMPDTVTKIEHGPFSYSSQVSRIVIGNGVGTIDFDAFFGCTGLTSIVLGSHVALPIEFIGDYFFQNRHLASIEVAPAHPTLSSVDGVLYDKSQTTVLWCPSGKHGRLVVPETVVEFNVGAFDYALGLTSIYFEGPAPTTLGSGLDGAPDATVYYLPDAAGWGAEFSGRPTALWEPGIDEFSVGWDALTQEFGFTIHWAGDRAVVVETCTELTLADWTPVATVTLANGHALFRDPDSLMMGTRFYRVHRP